MPLFRFEQIRQSAAGIDCVPKKFAENPFSIPGGI